MNFKNTLSFEQNNGPKLDVTLRLCGYPEVNIALHPGRLRLADLGLSSCECTSKDAALVWKLPVDLSETREIWEAIGVSLQTVRSTAKINTAIRYPSSINALFQQNNTKHTISFYCTIFHNFPELSFCAYTFPWRNLLPEINSHPTGIRVCPQL